MGFYQTPTDMLKARAKNLKNKADANYAQYKQEMEKGDKNATKGQRLTKKKQ